MPLLDLQATVQPTGVVSHKFYKKNVASKMTILKRSALNGQIKRSTAIQEGVRRLRNCCDGVDWKDRSDILSDWSATLRRSGYSAKYRQEVIEASLAIYEKIQEDDKSGARPMYRERKWEKKRREEEKEKEE